MRGLFRFQRNLPADGRMQPDVPTYDADEVRFSVNDTIVDVSMEWIEQLWRDLAVSVYQHRSLEKKAMARGQTLYL